MKEAIHPKYYPNATVVCACGNTWTTGSTVETIRTDICSQCHPFFTGEQRIVDTEGQVDRFYKKLEARQQFVEERAAREAERTSPDRPIADLELSKRAVDSLAKAGITNVGQVLEKLESGEAAVVDPMISLRAEPPIRYVVPQKIAPARIRKRLFSTFFPWTAIQVEHTLRNPVLEACSGGKKIWEGAFSKLIARTRYPVPVEKFEWNRVDSEQGIVLRVKSANRKSLPPSL